MIEKFCQLLVQVLKQPAYGILLLFQFYHKQIVPLLFLEPKISKSFILLLEVHYI